MSAVSACSSFIGTSVSVAALTAIPLSRPRIARRPSRWTRPGQRPDRRQPVLVSGTMYACHAFPLPLRALQRSVPVSDALSFFLPPASRSLPFSHIARATSVKVCRLAIAHVSTCVFLSRADAASFVPRSSACPQVRPQHRRTPYAGRSHSP